MSIGVPVVLLPQPTADEWDWQLQARCRGDDSAVFFSPLGERGRARARRTGESQAALPRMPLVSPCRDYALDAGEPYGVWGGLDPPSGPTSPDLPASASPAAQLRLR